jgi:hypothetical protein
MTEYDSQNIFAKILRGARGASHAGTLGAGTCTA